MCLKTLLPGVWLARGKHPQPHYTIKPSAYKPPAYKPAEESDDGLSDAGNTHICLTGGPVARGTQGLSNLPKDQPDLGETTYATSESSLCTNGVILPITQVGRMSLLHTGGPHTGLCRILGGLCRQAAQSTNHTNYTFILLRIYQLFHLLIWYII